MNTCKDCKWWDKFSDTKGTCRMPEQEGAPVELDAAFGCEDLEMDTVEWFGCIKWEAKDEDQ